MKFYTDCPVYCPKCKAVYMKSDPGIRRGVHLECTHPNYGDLPIDYAQCPE